MNGRNPILAHEYLGPDIAGKDIIVVDDILSSGDSILDLAVELKNRKARRIFPIVTFAFFTNGIEAFQRAYEDGLIEKVFATNLCYRREELKDVKWFATADMSKYMSYIIATLNHDRSLSGLLNPHNRISNLLNNYLKEQGKL